MQCRERQKANKRVSDTPSAISARWDHAALRSKILNGRNRPDADQQRTAGCAEADLADKTNKLICLRDPKLEPKRIPMPFAENDHIIPVGDMPGLIAALALKGAKPRI